MERRTILSSVSPHLDAEAVNSLATITVISLSSQIKANGQTQYLLVATTKTLGGTHRPAGTVVFRKNGRSIGSARLKNGTAVLRLSGESRSERAIRREIPGSARFGPSNSAAIVVG